MATKVILGGIEFSPAPKGKIKFNNPRSIAKVDIPGGAPVSQDMGEDETTISWEGVLTGEGAYNKAVQIEILKDQGKAIDLFVSDFPEMCKSVRIRSFPWDIVRKDRIEYSIELVAETPSPPLIVTTTAAATILGQASGDIQVIESSTPAAQSCSVQQGDTLWALAVNYLGDGSRWREIADANGISDPRSLQIGQELTIPMG